MLLSLFQSWTWWSDYIQTTEFWNRISQKMKGQARPSVARVFGTEPGVLDKTQRSRLLRHPKATLSFATFDPYVATSQDPADISRLSLQEDRYRSKRIVVETIPGRGSSWRWVPAARKKEGVQDEGVFPRLIDICGQVYECSQEQWDIYKLDPIYNCLVEEPPALSVVAFKGPNDVTGTSHHADGEQGTGGEPMVVDDEGPSTMGKGKPRSGNGPPSAVFESVSTTQGMNTKRLGEENEYSAEDIINRNSKLYISRNHKRARTSSPQSGRRAMNAHRSQHEARKGTRWREEMALRKEVRERNFMQQVFEVLEGDTRHNGSGHMQDILEDQFPDDLYDQAADEEHPKDLAESFRKMAELNADRELERQREKQLRGEQEARSSARVNHLHADAERKSVSEEAVKEKEKEQSHLREQGTALLEDRTRLRAKVLGTVERERRMRNDQWISGPWTTTRAIERYKAMALFFDKARFSEETFPLAFIDIPWPTLRHPLYSRPRDIDWESTNEFFCSVKPTLRGQAYRDFLKQCLQRFHPDRWSSRGLFACILDESERNEIEAAINAVSKALGALYAEARSSYS